MNVSMAGSGGISPTQMAQELFKKADENGDGGIDKSELKTMMANGPGGSKSSSDVDKLFAKIDTNSDGKIDQTENSNFLEKIGKEMQARMGTNGPGGGGPPGGAGGGMPPGGAAQGAGAAGGSSGSGKTYDPKDTNQDGTVSLQEEMQYALKQLGSSQGSQPSSKASADTGTTKKLVDALMTQMEKGTKYSEFGTASIAAGGTPSLLTVKA